ncbi:MAG: phosphatidylglycerol lysyltransferase domain-containing protein [Acetobacteraceae bacterium]
MRRGLSTATLPGWLRHVPPLLGVALLFGAIYAVQHEFRHLKPGDIVTAIDSIAPWALALSFGFTVLSYSVLTLYDRLGTWYAGHKVGYARVAFTSFCAYALSHNLGFGAVSGAAVRYRLYAQWGLTPLQIAKTVAFCSLTFGLGGMVLGGAILLLEPADIPYFGTALPIPLLRSIGVLLWLIVLGYVILAGRATSVTVLGHDIALPGWRMALLQVPLATTDVSVSATIVWILLPHAPHLTWTLFLGIYVASYTAGLLAALPGGLGVFDTALLFGLAPELPVPRIVAAIAVFRLYYYVIPLFLAGTLFAANEVLLRGEVLLGRFGRVTRLERAGRWSEPDFAVAASSGAVALCGILLLGVGLFSLRSPDLTWADPDLSEMASHAGQFIPSLLGAALLVLGLGLIHRVSLAWGATLVVLIFAAAFVLAEGERAWIAAVLVFTALLLTPFRRCFYRRARLLSGPLDPPTAVSLLALLVCILALAGFRHRVHGVPNNAWWEIVLSSHMPWGLRASVALTVAMALAAVWLLVRPGRVRWAPWNAEARVRLFGFGAPVPVRADGVIWGEAERAAIPFRRVGRILLALGDPSGAETDRVSAIWRLRDLARQEGLDPAVWRAGSDLLKVYGNIGLIALPLGPDGLPLSDLADDGRPGTEYLVCAAERDLTSLLPLLPSLTATVQYG